MTAPAHAARTANAVSGHNPSPVAVTINGEVRSVAAGSTIADLVAHIGLDPAKVAVERNREIVPRSTLHDVQLAEGDVLEIVHFVGGGC